MKKFSYWIQAVTVIVGIGVVLVPPALATAAPTLDEVIIACGTAYDTQEQFDQCIDNICLEYGCT